MARITRRLVGQAVTFAGYDGHTYTATVQAVAQGVARVTYPVTVSGVCRLVTGYVVDGARLEPVRAEVNR